jgi:hypothetical protein
MSYPTQDNPATWAGVAMVFLFAPVLLIYDWVVGLNHESVKLFYLWVPCTLLYDAIIRLGFQLESISEFIWKTTFRRGLACVWTLVSALIFVASTPQYAIFSVIYCSFFAGLLIAHLGFQFLPGMRDVI